MSMVQFVAMVCVMDLMNDIGHLNWPDAVCVALFFATWLGLSWRINHPSSKHPSVTVMMSQYRRDWMLVMVTRQPRIFDAQIMTSLRQGTSFFASTCLLAMGGLLALIGNVDPLRGLAEGVGQVESSTTVIQLKLLLVLFMLGSAFLKFVWADRVFGYCSVMMGAVPNDPDDPQAVPLAAKAGELNTRAAMNFNAGLRSMYFALCGITWLGGPLVFLFGIAVTAWVVWSREFASVPREILLGKTPDTKV